MKNTEHVLKFIKDNEGICGIYAIICTKTWRSYVGQSARIGGRIKAHFECLRAANHPNQELLKDFKEFGADFFKCEILEVVENHNDLGIKEKYWQDFGENLYNSTPSNSKIELTEKQRNLFWSKIDKKSENECWIFNGCKDNDGYGRMGFRNGGKKKMFRANRLAYFLTYPTHNKDLIVCHKCDNPECCNPNHLFLDSFYGNNLDCKNKGRRSKLSWEHVNFIREKFKENPQIHGQELSDFLFKKFNIKVHKVVPIQIGLNKKWYDKNYIVPKRKNLRLIRISSQRNNKGKFIGDKDVSSN